MLKLSILIPSKREEGLEAFRNSLEANYSGEMEVQLVIVVDTKENEEEHVEFHSGKFKEIVVHVKPNGGNVGALLNEAYKWAHNEWIFIANDDIICETEEWDAKLAKMIRKYGSDSLTLFWFNDQRFEEKLSCFPIISKKAIDIIGLFPTIYKRFKIDDTLYHVFPDNRRVYLKHIVFKHLNPLLESGTHYEWGAEGIPEEYRAGIHDQTEWNHQAYQRLNAQIRLTNAIDGNRQRPTKVLIGIPTAEVSRAAAFYDYYNMLLKQENTVVSFAHGQSPAKNRNLIIEQALNADCSHILFLDDDVTFPNDMLNRLLKHDKDIVTGLMLMRNHPHAPIIFDWADEKGRTLTYYPKDGESGLKKIVASGFGCVLIKTDLLRKMEAPWIRLGELEADQWCDDIGFYKRAREITTDIWCDLDVQVGHIAQVVIYPNLNEEKQWLTVYNTNGAGQIAFPAIRP